MGTGAAVAQLATGRTTGFRFPAGSMTGIFLLTSASRPASGPSQSHIQWVTGKLTPVLKRPGSKVDYLSPSSAEVKNPWSYTSIAGGRDMWHAWGRGEVLTGFWLGGQKVRDHWEDLGVGGRITSKWTLGR
jgi:hypothetical protein